MNNQVLYLYKFLQMLDARITVIVNFVNYPYGELRYVGSPVKFNEWKLYNSFFDCYVIKIGLNAEGTLCISARSKDFF